MISSSSEPEDNSKVFKSMKYLEIFEQSELEKQTCWCISFGVIIGLLFIKACLS
uniref:Uncharacterized protein n=1 Tax=viral metagenome TaxID=1070528 RepID=A0A6C0LN42_9ZZZZ